MTTKGIMEMFYHTCSQRTKISNRYSNTIWQARRLRDQTSSSDSKAIRKSEMLSVLKFQGREEKMFKDKGSLRK